MEGRHTIYDRGYTNKGILARATQQRQLSTYRLDTLHREHDEVKLRTRARHKRRVSNFIFFCDGGWMLKAKMAACPLEVMTFKI